MKVYGIWTGTHWLRGSNGRINHSMHRNVLVAELNTMGKPDWYVAEFGEGGQPANSAPGPQFKVEASAEHK